MQKIVMRYGLVAGTILAAFVASMVPLSKRPGFEHSEVVGYSAMVLAFLLVFFGVRSYRDTVANGAVGFGKAFQVGLLITLVACAMYVITWEIVYFNFLPDFLDHYNAQALDKLRASGADEAALTKAAADMEALAKLYANPLFNAGITFLEVFPVGLLMTLISAAILRRKAAPEAPGTIDTAARPA